MKDNKDKAKGTETIKPDAGETAALKSAHDDLIKQLEEMEERAKKAEAALVTRNNDYYKALADAANYKKRLDQEQERERVYRYQPLLEKLIDPLDLLMHVVSMPTTDPTLSAYLTGFTMITSRINELLESEGVKRVTVLGKPFDPATSHAIETKWDEKKDDGVVLEERQAGYLYKDRLLRPAFVVVNKRPEEEHKQDLTPEDVKNKKEDE